MEGRFSVVIPGSISQYVIKRKGNPVIFITYLGGYISEKDAKSVFEEERLRDKLIIVLPADLATPLLEILGTLENRFYNMDYIDPEFTNRLFASSCVQKQQSLVEYEAMERLKVDARLVEYEEEQRRRIRRFLERLIIKESHE